MKAENTYPSRLHLGGCFV